MNRRSRHNDDDDFDERGILKDRHTFRTPMTMADGASDPCAVIYDAHQPGPVRSRDQSAFDAKERAYREREYEDANAWRNPALRVSDQSTGTPYAGARVGDLCTVRSGGTDEGASGRFEMIDGQLVCVADDPAAARGDHTDASPTFDERFVENDRAEITRAYAEYDQRMADAWRGPRSSGRW
jgi:hypothetical protein